MASAGCSKLASNVSKRMFYPARNTCPMIYTELVTPPAAAISFCGVVGWAGCARPTHHTTKSLRSAAGAESLVINRAHPMIGLHLCRVLSQMPEQLVGVCGGELFFPAPG